MGDVSSVCENCCLEDELVGGEVVLASPTFLSKLAHADESSTPTLLPSHPSLPVSESTWLARRAASRRLQSRVQR